MFFAYNRSMLIWFLTNILLFFSHFLVIWTLYYFTYNYKAAPLEFSALIWAIGISIVAVLYLSEVLFIMIKFYPLWNRPFLTVSDYYQWYLLNRFLTYTTFILLMITTFFSLRKLPISVGNAVYQNADYLIYLIFIPILIFNAIVVWYNYKYKKIIRTRKKASNKVELVSSVR
ncbi:MULTISPECIES: hypothetical protein [unclassified Spiroplasma]|uniref:hypothetical protein n=1 Tax=unclassified Spiroplasma TaxID=2637901 RepID=UPI00313E53D4